MIPVVLCLAGMTPAVVTETLFGLSVISRPKVVPHRICILTTEAAYPLVVSTLLGKDGAIRRLCSEYRLPAGCLECGLDDVLLLRARSGKPMSDIRTSADSRAAGESISTLLDKLHSDPAVELHCSIAGGRKTMGALLALALQMSARAGDRLYHVLVNDPFERITEFYYPPRRRVFYSLDGRRIDSSRARVELAEIPLIRMGTVSESLGMGTGDLAQRARRIQEAVDRRFRVPRLELDLADGRLRMARSELRLPPQELALFALYASLRQKCRACATSRSAGCAGCQPTDAELFDRHRADLLGLYAQCRAEGGEKLVDLLSRESGRADSKLDFDEWLRQTRSRLNRRIRRAGEGFEIHGFRLLVRSATLELKQRSRRGTFFPPELINIHNVEGTAAQR